VPTTHRIPFGIVSLPEGDYFDTEARVDRRPAGRERVDGRGVAVRARLQAAVSLR
jgi:hypothetical protein